MVDNSKENPSQRLGRYTTRLRRKLPLPRAWHLRMDLHRIDKIYAPLVANATGQEREQLDSAWAFERILIDEEHQGIVTERLQKKANRLLIPTPLISSDNWERGPNTGIWYLTSEGASRVRRAIHEERKRRQEIWLPGLAVVVGVISAFIGLVLALKKG